MHISIKKHFEKVLRHLYINPLEKCNLRCKICYTRKTDPILKEEEILEFIERYQRFQKLETVTFCGGEVFSLPYFTGLVNKLTEQGPVPRVSQLRSSIESRNQIAEGMYFSDSATTFSEGPAARHPSAVPDKTSHQKGTWLASPTHGLDKRSNGIFVQIITNGTIDKLDEFENPNLVNMIVSIDGLRDYHDKNRGKGNFDKSIKFLLKARKLGFHTEIFSIVTRQNIYRIEEFENYINHVLNQQGSFSEGPAARHPSAVPDNTSHQKGIWLASPILGSNKQTIISITYHPRKPSSYLMHHPISNIRGITDGFDFLDKDDLITLMRERTTFPPKDLGCFQISLASDGKIYGCCEGTVPIGKIDDKIEDLFDRLEARLEIWDKKNKIGKCLGCSQPDFVCGLKQILSKIPMSKSKDTKQIQITKSK